MVNKYAFQFMTIAALWSIHFTKIIACDRTADSLALVAFYNATHENGDWNVEWNLNQPMSTWFGVELGSDGCVEILDLNDNNLEGQLPAAFFQLTEIRRLHLTNHEIYGPLPAEISNLQKLQILVLNGNSFTSPLPSSLASMNALRTLGFYSN